MKESELNKSKALYQQKIELLELENQEIKENSESQKAMYENMLKALQGNSDSTGYEKYMERINQYHKVQEEELLEIRKTYDNQLIELRQKLAMQEATNK